ncbi:N/A [soil metagenome]
MYRSNYFDLAVGIVSQVMLVGSGLIMLPFVVTHLSAPEVAVWYIYLTIQAMVFLLDFGMTETFIRFFSYVFSGVGELSDTRMPERSGDGQLDPSLLAAMIGASRRVYFYMTLIAAVLMSTVGSFYIHAMTGDGKLAEPVWPSWCIFVVTMLAQTYFQWQGLPLIGSGRTRRNYEIAVRSRTVQVIATVVALLIHPSLTVMSCAFALSAIAMRVDYHLALRPIRAQIAGVTGPFEQHGNLDGVLWRSARRQGSSVIGVLLTNRLVGLSVAWFAGLTMSAQYAIANQALVALTSVAFVVPTMLGPRVANAGVSGDRDAQRGLFSVSLLFGWAVYAAGGVVLIVVVPYLLKLIGSNTSLPPVPILLLMLLIYVLEMNMFTSTRMITLAENAIPYWRAMLVTGAVIVVSVLLAGNVGLGLAGILIAQLLPQAAYNYWRWPAYCFALLGLKVREVPSRAFTTARQAFGRAT